MNNSSLESLLMRYFQGNISQQERIELEKLLDEADNAHLEDILHTYFSNNEFNSLPNEDVLNKLNITKVLNTVKPISAAKNNIVSLQVLKYAVAVVLFVVSGLFIYNTYFAKKLVNNIVSVNDINPAQSLAQISLPDGELFTIDSTSVGLVYNQDGISVYRNAEGEIVYKVDSNTVDHSENQYLSIVTPKGGFSKIQLSDGTLVSLNAGSTFKYPLTFASNSREVYATGEIFFDVAKDSSRPFKVISDNQTIEVLGTKFNLIADDLKSKTTLLEGSVKILHADRSYFLKPGQEAVVDKDVKIVDVNAEKSIGWKNDQFVFDNSSFIEILKEVENWYDIKFVFESDELLNVQMSGSVSRKVKLSEILKVLEINTDYKFEMKGRRVVVK